MYLKVEILTLSKDIDEELYKTVKSIIKSSKNLTCFNQKKFKYNIIIKNYKTCPLLENIIELLQSTNLDFNIIPESKIIKIKTTIFQTAKWYMAVNATLDLVDSKSYLWFLNAGDYAEISSLKIILKYLQLASKGHFIGIAFYSRITLNEYSFIKPKILKGKNDNNCVLSMLPCFQSVLIKAEYLQKYKKLISKGVEGTEQIIVKELFKENLICFIPKILSVFNYGGTSTTKKLGSRKRFHNLKNFIKQKRGFKIFSELIKLLIELFSITFFTNFFIFFTSKKNIYLLKIFPILKLFNLHNNYIVSPLINDHSITQKINEY